MRKSISVTVEYIGGWSSVHAQEYRVTKLIGVPAFEMESGKVVRIGDVVSEKEAFDIASKPAVEWVTLPRKARA